MQPCSSCQRPLPEGAILCPFDGTPAPHSTQLAANQKLGEYILQEKIGEGSMGEVWRGVHPTISKRVAIKALHPDTLLTQESLTRFIQEAKIVNEIQHRNLVDIFSFGELDNGRPYFVMEHLDGKSLAEHLAERGPLPFSELLALFEQVCAALSAAHDKGVLHRDLKPSNIFLLPQKNKPPFVKLIDFGIAKLPKGEQGTLTQTNAIFGTPAYMSPEHCDGVRFVDYRADLYSLGIVLYECITGKNPFATYPGAPMGEILLRHLSLEPPPVSQSVSGRRIPPALDRFVKKTLSKKKEERPESAAAFYEELKLALGKLSAEQSLAGAAPKIAKFKNPTSPSRAPWVVSSLALFAVALGAFAYSQRETPPAAPLQLEPPRRPQISLEVDSSPPGASVYLDDVLLGETPLAKSIASQDTPRMLRLEKVGFVPQQTSIMPTSDRQKKLYLEPLPAASKAPTSSPPDAAPKATKPPPIPAKSAKKHPDDDPNSTFNPFQ